jgi:hypothetical protein
MLFSATRPCLLNGIPDLAGRPDLADRAIVVSLPVIPPAERAFEGEFNKLLDAAMPRILAGLLDAVSSGLANLATVQLTERPRMADFAKWVSATEPALGWTQGAFLEAYAANRDSGDRATVEGNPVGLAILKLVDENGRWSGTMTELKTILRNRYPLLTDDPYSFHVRKTNSPPRSVGSSPHCAAWVSRSALIVAAIQVNAPSGLKDPNGSSAAVRADDADDGI